jgi:SAM-dependent methyltransferase
MASHVPRKFIEVLRKTGMMRVINSVYSTFFRFLKWIASLMGMNPLDAVYTKGFFKDVTKATAPSAAIVARSIVESVDVKSTIDVGCGPGVYLHEMQKLDVEVLGIDGSAQSRQQSVLDPSLIILKNVTKPLNIDRRFDVVICFEVAEHIPKQSSQVLVSNLVSLGDVVFFTAAPPGQGGTDHINEQPMEFWTDLFARQNFHLDKGLTESIRSEWREKEVVWWLHRNLMIFRKSK